MAHISSRAKQVEGAASSAPESKRDDESNRQLVFTQVRFAQATPFQGANNAIGMAMSADIVFE